MGLTCKPFGKYKRIIARTEYRLAKEAALDKKRLKKSDYKDADNKDSDR